MQAGGNLAFILLRNYFVSTGPHQIITHSPTSLTASLASPSSFSRCLSLRIPPSQKKKLSSWAPPKIYVRQPKGSLEHGRMDLPSYSAKEFTERLKKYEADWLLESRIMADSTVVSPPPVARRPPPPEVRTSLREELREDPTPPLPRRAHVDLSANAVLDTPPSMRTNVSIKKDFKIYYGLESTDGEREILQDQDEAFRWAELENWNLTGMWTDQVRASTWMSMAPVFLSKVRPREVQRKHEGADQRRRDNEAKEEEENNDGREGGRQRSATGLSGGATQLRTRVF